MCSVRCIICGIARSLPRNIASATSVLRSRTSTAAAPHFTCPHNGSVAARGTARCFSNTASAAVVPATAMPVSPVRAVSSRTSVSWVPTSVQVVKLNSPFKTTLGAEIPQVSVKCEQHGLASLPASRTIVIFPSFSHSSHVASNSDDQSPGWWEDVVGPGKTIDTNRWRVICCSLLGSPHSLTSPVALNPVTERPYRNKFPPLTPTDLARCHHAVLQQLGVTDTLHAVVGSSLGGMQALQFASLFPQAAARVAAIATTGRTTPFTVGIRRMQRKAILSDPAYHGGDYADHGTGPFSGLAIARELGTLFYRSRQEFDSRFQWTPFGDRHYTSNDTWEVETYLNYQGAKFVRTYDANCYLLLSKCMDLMDLGDGAAGRATYAEGAARIAAEALLVGVRQDALIPAAELRCLAASMNAAAAHAAAAAPPAAERCCLPCEVGGGGGAYSSSAQHHDADGAGAGGAGAAEHATHPHHATQPQRATYLELDSVYGHDAFLKEPAWLRRHLKPFLERGLEEQLAAEERHNTGDNAP